MNKRDQIAALMGPLMPPHADAPQGRTIPTRGTRQNSRGLIDYYLGPTGIPQRLEAVNQMFNPVEGIGQSMQASQRAFAPDTSPWGRFEAVGDMLSGVAGAAAPMVAASRVGGPAADAVVEAMTSVGAAGRQAAGQFAADESGALRLPVARSQAQEIAYMLASGRADEVTDDMMAQADPQELFKLYESGATGADMPMDAASRMQRAQGAGFDTQTPLYRGDDGGLDQFRTGHLSRENIGVTTSTKPNVAATYMLKDTSAMYPVMSSAQNRLELDAGGRNWTGVPADASTNRGALNDVIEPENYLDEDNLFDFQNGAAIDWGDGSATEMAMSDTNSISRAAQDVGFDEVRFQNIIDRGGAGQWHTGPANDPHTTVMTANPANIRSRFARFDPRLAHLRNLSAGFAGAGLMTMYPQDQQ